MKCKNVHFSKSHAEVPFIIAFSKISLFIFLDSSLINSVGGEMFVTKYLQY
jgi:hypothetical protein